MQLVVRHGIEEEKGPAVTARKGRLVKGFPVGNAQRPACRVKGPSTFPDLKIHPPLSSISELEIPPIPGLTPNSGLRIPPILTLEISNLGNSAP